MYQNKYKFKGEKQIIAKDNFRILSNDEKLKYKFEECEQCEFYECELINEYMLVEKNNFDTDSQIELKNGCIMKRFSQEECGTKYVADGIGDHFKINTRYLKIEKNNENRWEPDEPVFISAQTGTGKNHFIENTLLPYVRQLNIDKRTDQKVLILSNRIALRLQIEDRIKCDKNDQKFEEDKIYHHKKFPFTDVMSYQGLLNKAGYLKRIQENKEAKNKRYIFVVCDEAHFFTSDAMFNPDTGKIISTIVSIFHNAIRLYMTATPYDCLEYIYNYENKMDGVLYHFKRDYNYLDIKYYSNEAELIELIVPSKEKWLIFLDDKEKCKTLKNKLDDHFNSDDESKSSVSKDTVFAVDASSKNNKKYQDIILKERFGEETKVLITTSVIDNGVNFKDPKLKHVVISDISKAKCLQMVGRVRLENKEDKITLYLKRTNEQYMEKRIRDLEEQQDAYHAYDLAYDASAGSGLKRGNSEYEFLDKYKDGTFKDHEDAIHWFGRELNDPKKLYINGIARSLANKLVINYKSILEEMQRTDKGEKVTGQKYLEYMLSWFGQAYIEENDITLQGNNNVREDFDKYITGLVDKVISKDEKEAFRIEFSEKYNKAYGFRKKKDGFKGDDNINRTNKYDIKIINEIFIVKEMNLELVDNKDDTWTIKAKK